MLRDISAQYDVSIGPRLFRHGNPPEVHGPGPIWHRFNWATSFQTWKSGGRKGIQYNKARFQLGHVLSDMEIPVLDAVPVDLSGFNWATSFQTWKSWYLSGFLDGLKMFQLGHVLSDMEIAQDRFYDYWVVCGVSIGPRPFRHGNNVLLF